MALPIHSDRAYLPEGGPHTTLLYPFWGKNPEDPADPNTGRFDRYVQAGMELFCLVGLDEAALAVFPADWGRVTGDPAQLEHAERFFDAAEEAATPSAVFFWSDSVEPVPRATTVFRTSFYRSRRLPGEFAQPAWSEDFVEHHLGGTLPVRPKGPKPVVGFCGLAPAGWRRALQLVLGRRADEISSLRDRALRALERESRVSTNFVRRSQFLGGAVASGEVAAATMQRVRREYVANMVESDYVLCARGAGNFSYRLYETLSCGRIPVFVDTDCVLPYDFLLDWRDYCVWIDESDLEAAGEAVAAFHEGLSDDEFTELQRECRRLWERYLSPEGFFANFHRHFEDGRGS